MKTESEKEPNRLKRSLASIRNDKNIAATGHLDNRSASALQRQLMDGINNTPQAIAQRQIQAQINDRPLMTNQRKPLEKGSGEAVQRQGGIEDEELLQGKLDKMQQQGDLEEEELLQGKFDTAQLEGQEEEELLQGKFDTVQRVEHDELLQGKFETAQKKENNTGLPDNLKSGIENLSGVDMSDVCVHRNSNKPAQLNALAYAQGNDIHLGTGQEQHLPHEAWHTVQHKQGKVQPTMQMAGIHINDDAGLEKEADVMGGRAAAGTVQAVGQKARHDPVCAALDKGKGKSKSQFSDRRAEAISHRKLGEMADNSPQAKKATQLQAMADDSAVLQMPGVIQGSFWKSVKRLFGWKTPQERAIQKAEKKADKLTKKHKKYVRKFLNEMGELNDQLLEAYGSGNDKKAEEIENKIEELSQKYDEIRDETEEAVNDFSDKVGEVHEQMSELISQDITGITKEEEEEIGDELSQLDDEIEEQKSTIAKEDEKAKVLRSEIISIKEKPKKEMPQKEEGEIRKRLAEIQIPTTPLGQSEEERLAEIQIPATPLGQSEEERLAEIQIPTTPLGQSEEERLAEIQIPTTPLGQSEEERLAEVHIPTNPLGQSEEERLEKIEI